MASSTFTTTVKFNNIEQYNDLRRFLINCEGYTYSQLFGLKFNELWGLFDGDAATVYKVTGSKRMWCRMQLDRLISWF